MSGVTAADLASAIPALLATPRSPSQITLLSSLLSHIKFFQSCSDSLLPRLSEVLQIQVFCPGQVICSQGDPAQAFYLVLKGSIAVSYTEDGDSTTVMVAKLAPGASFGEAAMHKDQARGASLCALTDCALLMLTRQDYESVSDQVTKESLELKAAFLRTVPLFEKLSKQGLLKLSNFFTELKYARGDVIYREHDPPSNVFLLISGEVEFVKSHSKSTREAVNIDSLIGPRTTNRDTLPLRRLLSRKQFTHRQDLKLCVKGAREMFGEEEVLAECPRVTSAYCRSLTAVALVIGKLDFVRRLQNPEMWGKIQALNEKKQGWTTARIEDLSCTTRLYSPRRFIKRVPGKHSVSPILEKKWSAVGGKDEGVSDESTGRVFTTEVSEMSPMQRSGKDTSGDNFTPAKRRLEVSQRSLAKLLQPRPRMKENTKIPPHRLANTAREHPVKLSVDIRMFPTDISPIRTRQGVAMPSLKPGILKNR